MDKLIDSLKIVVKNNIVIDSRLVNNGDLFVALAGETTDGHQFLSAAKQNGAIAALVTHIPPDAPHDFLYLLVDDCRAGLEHFASYKRAVSEAKFIAITGSVGKTTTKEMIKHVFSKFGCSYASYGNYNNYLGVPICLASMPIDAKYATFEIGMNSPGEITPLTKLVRPDIAIITNVEEVHLQFFNSVQDIAFAKAEIMQGLSEQGCIILNKDNQFYDLLKSIAYKANIKNIISFGHDENADARLISYMLEDGISKVEASIYGKKLKYQIGSPGIHLALDSLSVLAAVYASGEDLESAASQLADFTAVKGRGKTHILNKNNIDIILIDDSYNASAPSIKAALKVLNSYQNKDKLAILADIRELGEDSAKIHTSLLDDILENNIDKIITVGENMSLLYSLLPKEKQLACFSHVDELIPLVVNKYIQPNQVILVKGSLGTRISKIVDVILAA